MIDEKENKQHAFESITSFVRRSFRRSGRRNSSTKSLDGLKREPSKPMMPSKNFIVEFDCEKTTGLF